MKKTVVIALGGNAITTKREKGSYQEIKRNVKEVCKHIAKLTKIYNLVIVSVSGPQVGNLVIQNELAKSKVPSMPLHVLDAELEGELGYIIEQELGNITNIPITTILTRVLINKKDRLFRHPTKPIGPFYSKKQAEVLRKKGLKMINDADRGYRRVVPSPKPIRIIEADVIRRLLKKNINVIAAGGGGIPVYKIKNKFKGVDAVIDKDLASACLASEIKADLLLILTGVRKVYLNYNKKNQKSIDKMNIKEAKKYISEGHFPEGSAGPKIQAAINFLNKGGKKVIITSPSCVDKALKGEEGTLIVN